MYAANQNSYPTNEKTLVTHGIGIPGAIQFEPEILDLQTVLIGTSNKSKITLHNSSNCELFYKLEAIEDINVV